MVATGICSTTLLTLIDELLFLLFGTIDDLFLCVGSGFQAIDHPVRRRVLAELVNRTAINRRELAELLADDAVVPYDDVEQLDIVLHHHHLPKLADHDYIEYDPRSGDVVLWRDPSTVMDHLESSVS